MASREVKEPRTGHASYTALQGKEFPSFSQRSNPARCDGQKTPITPMNPRRIQKFRRCYELFSVSGEEWNHGPSRLDVTQTLAVALPGHCLPAQPLC